MKRVNILRAILALNAVVTVAAMVFAYRALQHADESERLVIRSHRTLQAAEETLRRAVDAETWERGYLLTRDAQDLEAFKRAVPLTNEPLESLAVILREDGRGAEAARLRADMAAMLAGYEQLVERARAGGIIDPADRTAARARMETLRGTIRTIRRSETDVLNARIRADASAGRRVNWLAIVMTGLATALLTMLLAAIVFLARPGVWRGR